MIDSDVAAAHDQIRAGLPLASIEAWGLTAADIAAVLGKSVQTIRRRRSGTLTVDEGDICYRFGRAYMAATDLFGSREAAQEWLYSEQPALGFRRPIDLMVTYPGSVAVSKILGRIRHGVYT